MKERNETVCRACGHPRDADADRCPHCRVSRQEGRAFWIQFWIALLGLALLMALAAAALPFILRPDARLP